MLPKNHNDANAPRLLSFSQASRTNTWSSPLARINLHEVPDKKTMCNYPRAPRTIDVIALSALGFSVACKNDHVTMAPQKILASSQISRPAGEQIVIAPGALSFSGSLRHNKSVISLALPE